MFTSRLSRVGKHFPRRYFGMTNAEANLWNHKHLARTQMHHETVITKGEGVWLEDVEGNKLLDFHAGYCCTNQGHSHPRIIEALTTQAKKLAMCSRTFNSDISAEYAEFMADTFGYEKIIPMGSGTEACETAVKTMRRWGVRAKGIDNDKVTILFPEGTFWGRSIGAISGCQDPLRYKDFGPLCPGFDFVPYNDAESLEKKLQENPNIAGYLVESVQGSAGVIVPDDDYLRKVREICTKYNVLCAFDEVQAGLGRCGDLLAHYHEEGVRPDLVTFGKSLTGGMMPVSAVIGDGSVIDHIGVGEHGNTYGGFALGCAVAKAGVEVVIDEGLSEKSKANGEFLRDEVNKFDSPLFDHIRGRGLFNSFVLNRDGVAMDLAEALAKNGLILKCTHERVLRISPPLTISREEITQGLEIIAKTLKQFE